MRLNIDVLHEFEEGLDTVHPENSKIPLRILGYGEISTVFEILYEDFKDTAFKRLPLFKDEEKATSYIELYKKYNELLRSIGLSTPEYGGEYVLRKDGLVTVYLYQKKFPSNSIGNNVIHIVSEEEIERLFNEVLNNIIKVWRFNSENKENVMMGLDGQISNWAVVDYDGQESLPNKITLFYLDTSTPLIREKGKELIDAELFLKATPLILRWILKKIYLQEILDRYYDLHSVIVDLIANLYKEKRPDIIPQMIEIANEFFGQISKEMQIDKITFEEVEKYYRSDASIWSIYFATRKIHRFIRTRILRSYYEFILPEKIER